MDFANFEQLAAARFPALAADVETHPGTLQVHEPSCPNPLYAKGVWLADHALVTSPPEGDRLAAPASWRISLFYGSFVEAAAGGDRDWEAWVAEVLDQEIAALASLISTSLALPTEQALYTEHAAWRRGEPTHSGWYRLGETLDAGVWAVDLDVFCELRLRPEEWSALAGTTIDLQLGEDTLPLELPEDLALGEELLLEGAGLVEDDPALAAALEEGDEVDESLVRQGDFVVICTRA